MRKLEVFGSATNRVQFDPATSDIDLVIAFVDCGPEIVDRFFGFSEDIETLLGRHVDFIFGNKPIKNPYVRASVTKSRVTIFESAHRDAAA